MLAAALSIITTILLTHMYMKIVTILLIICSKYVHVCNSNEEQVLTTQRSRGGVSLGHSESETATPTTKTETERRKRLMCSETASQNYYHS